MEKEIIDPLFNSLGLKEEDLKKDYGSKYPKVTDADKVSDWEKILYDWV